LTGRHRLPHRADRRASFWACVLLGLIIGVSAFDAAYATAATPPSRCCLTLPVSLALPSCSSPALSSRVSWHVRSSLGPSIRSSDTRGSCRSAVKWLVLVLTRRHGLDHLQIGGNVVELAFGILFGASSSTLALAIGLGFTRPRPAARSKATLNIPAIAAPHLQPPAQTIPSGISEYFRTAEDGVVDLRTVPNDTGKMEIPV